MPEPPEADDCIVLKVPRSVKGRWVAESRKGNTKLVLWVIARVENSLPVTLSGAKPTEEYGEPGEELTTVTLPCSWVIKRDWQKLARRENLRLTDWIVNRVEFAYASEK